MKEGVVLSSPQISAYSLVPNKRVRGVGGGGDIIYTYNKLENAKIVQIIADL